MGKMVLKYAGMEQKAEKEMQLGHCEREMDTFKSSLARICCDGDSVCHGRTWKRGNNIEHIKTMNLPDPYPGLAEVETVMDHHREVEEVKHLWQ